MCYLRLIPVLLFLLSLWLLAAALPRHWAATSQHNGVTANASYTLVFRGPRRRRLPGALIIGVKKGGTRALLQFMRLNPSVRAPGPEVHFFDKNYHKGLSWYRSRMPHAHPGQLVMEKTPAYFVESAAPERVFALNPKMRLVLIVRDPVTRAISDYAQADAKRRENGIKPDLKAFEELMFQPNGDVDSTQSAIRLGLYARYLHNWRRYFPPEQMLVVASETLVRRPFEVVHQVERFLGLRPVVRQDVFYFDRVKGFYCLKRHWRTGRPQCLGRDKGRAHPTVSHHALNRLRAFYGPHNDLFFRQTGVNFGWNAL